MKKTIILLLLIFILLLSGCKLQNTSKNILLEDAFSITPYINIIGNKKDINKYEKDIYNDLSNTLKELDDKFSVNKENSIVSTINKNSGKSFTEVDEEVLNVIKSAIYVSKKTEDEKESKYDITIYPLIEKWNFKDNYYKETERNIATIPTSEELLSITSLVSYNKIIIEENSIKLEEEGMKIDLGSIVKGYACDKLASIMDTKYPCFSYILNIGGNVFTKGYTYRNNQKSSFRIGIQTPFYEELAANENKKNYSEAYYIGYINSLEEGTTVVTSGTYERYIMTSDGKKYHHILDKETGYPIDNDLYSVTIIFDEGDMSMLADAYSTALFSMGLKALSFANENNIGTVIVTKDNQILVSDSIKDRFVFNEYLKDYGYVCDVGNN